MKIIMLNYFVKEVLREPLLANRQTEIKTQHTLKRRVDGNRMFLIV